MKVSRCWIFATSDVSNRLDIDAKVEIDSDSYVKSDVYTGGSN